MPIGGLSTLVYVASDILPGPPKPGYLEAIIGAALDRDFPADYVTEHLRPWLTAGAGVAS